AGGAAHRLRVRLHHRQVGRVGDGALVWGGPVVSGTNIRPGSGDRGASAAASTSPRSLWWFTDEHGIRRRPTWWFMLRFRWTAWPFLTRKTRCSVDADRQEARSAAQGHLGPDFHQRDEDNIDASREPAAATPSPPPPFTAGQLLAHLDALLEEPQGHRLLMSG